MKSAPESSQYHGRILYIYDKTIMKISFESFTF